ncbi:hypothetical protein CYMTET_3992, partial [Cymbomonas tetramitiformis]
QALHHPTPSLTALQSKRHHPRQVSRHRSPSTASPDAKFTGTAAQGTVDAIICGDEGEDDVEEYLAEVNRVMAPNGVFVLISLAEARRTLPFLHPQGWAVNVHALQDKRFTSPEEECGIEPLADPMARPSRSHYMFVCTKGPPITTHQKLVAAETEEIMKKRRLWKTNMRSAKDGSKRVDELWNKLQNKMQAMNSRLKEIQEEGREVTV